MSLCDLLLSTPEMLRKPLALSLAAAFGSAMVSDVGVARSAYALPMAHVDALVPVTTCEDDLSAGSLREVLSSAVDGETVDMSSLQCSSISLAYGALFVTVDNLTISGNGQTLVGDINQNVLTHTGSGTLSLQRVSLADSAYDGKGGCLYSAGSVSFANGSISGCVASDAGGGAFIKGNLTLKYSNITANSVSGHATPRGVGGGAYVQGNVLVFGSQISGNSAIGDNSSAKYAGLGGGLVSMGALNVDHTTISGNQADVGGGVVGVGPSSELVDSTLSGNIASEGSAAYFGYAITLNSDTVAFNTLRPCGVSGCFQGAVQLPAYDSTVTLQIDNTIIANSGGLDLFAGSASVQGAHNLITSSSVQLNGTLTSDPQLLPLAANNSILSIQPKTHALAQGSPAIDAGGGIGTVSSDERGLPRSVGSAPDIGAYESTSDVIFVNGFEGS